MNIPTYPSFRQVQLDDKAFFDVAFRKDPPGISEFTFTNIYAWRATYGTDVSILGDIILLRAGGVSSPQFFNPIGAGDKKAVMTKVLGDFGGIFTRIPAETALPLDKDPRFSVREQPAHADYVYMSRDLASLSGKKNDGKRNLIKKFKSVNAYEYVPMDASSAEECLAFEEAWCIMKDCDSVEGLSNERRAVKEMARNFSGFHLIGGMIRIDGDIRAAAMAEGLNRDTMVMHILKADPGITGLYQTMMNEFISRSAGSFTYLNLEQDLGIEGLRKAKLSYHPAFMLKKYWLKLKEGMGSGT